MAEHVHKAKALLAMTHAVSHTLTHYLKKKLVALTKYFFIRVKYSSQPMGVFLLIAILKVINDF